MKRDVFESALLKPGIVVYPWYGERRVDGQFAQLYVAGAQADPVHNWLPGSYVQLAHRIIMVPDAEIIGQKGDIPLFDRVTPDGHLKIAAQSHDGKGTYEWTEETGWNIVDPLSYGANPVIYRGQELIKGEPKYGAPGLRYIDLDGRIVTSDETNNSNTDWARINHVTGFWEWTKLGNIIVGQLEDGAGLELDGQKYLLEPGFVQFIRFTRSGESCAVTIVKPQELKSVHLEFTESEVRLGVFPKYRPTPPIPPDPIPPKPEPEPPKPEPEPPKPDPVPPHPKPEPPPLEDDMKIAAYRNKAEAGFLPGEEHDNGNGTISIKKPNGKWLCVTPDGNVEERDTPGGVWESFKKGNGCIIAERDGGTRGPLVYVLLAAGVE